MERIEDLEAFLAVVEEGGLTAAARRLHRSLQAVSRSLASLEQGLGIALIQRSTRQSTPTEAGQVFYRRIKPAIGEIAEAREEATSQRSEPVGILRVTAPVKFAPPHIVPVVDAFMQRYPRVEVELKLSDHFVNFAEDDVDLAVRIGQMPDSSLMSRHLGQLRRVVFGAPSYFQQHGRPAHPNDLAAHHCITRTLERQGETWPFLIEGETRMLSGRFRANNTAAVYSAVALGMGLGFTPLWQIRHLIDESAVEVVLTEYEAPAVPIHAVWPASKLRPAKTKLFVDALASEMKLKRL